MPAVGQGDAAIPEVLEERTFDVKDFDEELSAAPDNREIGSSSLFENDRIRVWEVRLHPGERGAFHVHDRNYFWTVVDGGIGKQRSADGTSKLRRYDAGDTSLQANTSEDWMVHGSENARDDEIRFINVELLD